MCQVSRGTSGKARTAARRESASESVGIRATAAGASGAEKTSRIKEREVRSQELLPRSRPAAGKTNLEGVSKSEGKSNCVRVSRDYDATGVVTRACESSRVPHPPGKVVVVAFHPSGEGTS